MLATAYASLFGQDLGFSVTEVASDAQQRALRLEMPGVARLMAAEQGTHLFSGWGRATVVVQVVVTPLAGREAAAVLASQQLLYRDGLREPAAVDPFPIQPVIRAYDGEGLTLDLRTGLAAIRFS